MDNKSRMMGDCQVRFCERLKLKCFCLLDSCPAASTTSMNEATIKIEPYEKNNFIYAHIA
jgi:hypothetical protein